MTVDVTTHEFATGSGPHSAVHTLSGASRWEVDGEGYLHVWRVNPDAIIATFAPGWIAARQAPTAANTRTA